MLIHVIFPGSSKISNEQKTSDIKLTLYIAAHSSIKSIDHLSELLKNIGKGSKLAGLRLHRTKCSKLILDVVAPGMMKELLYDIGDRDYSLILDESTDVSTIKYIAYCVRYFSQKQNKIVTDFLGFNEVGDATAESLYNDFMKFISETGLKLENLIGIGTDGASNLCGCNKSLYTLLKNRVPKLQLIKCSCHSLNLASSRACEELPSTLEFLLRETRNWFSHSPLRQMTYSALYTRVNAGAKPSKLVQLSNTRWLAWTDAVSVNIKQWDELKEFFGKISKKITEKCYTARTLVEMYEDDTNYLYLLILDGILREVAHVNLAFQKTNADVTKLYTELKTLLLSLARRIFKPSFLNFSVTRNTSLNMLHQADIDPVKKALDKAQSEFGNSLLPLDSVDLGERFRCHAEKKTISQSALNTVKERAVAYITRLCKELVSRLPGNLAVINNVRYFSPKMCLARTSSVSVQDLPWELAGIYILFSLGRNINIYWVIIR